MIFRTLLLLAAFTLATPALSAEIEQVHIPRLHDVHGVAANDTLNIRAEPNAQAAILGELAPNATGIEVTALNSAGTWGRIGAGEVDGWVSMAYLAPRPFPYGGVPNGMRCFGTEPFWSLDFEEGGATYAEMGGPPPQAVPFSATRIYEVVAGFDISLPDRTMTGTIEPAACSDGMSDRSYGWQLLLLTRSSGNRSLLHGCCTLDQR